MAVTTKGFAGAAYQFDELTWAQYQARVSEIGYRHGVWSGGVVTVGSGTRAVSVAAVDGIAPGVWFVSDAATTLLLNANSGSNKRIDYIVAEVDWAAKATTIKAVPGVAAASPVAPALKQTAGVLWQMPLARVTVAGNATTVVAGDIESAATKRLQFDPIRGSISLDTIHGNATQWNTLGTVSVPDAGRPYRLLLSATVRFTGSAPDNGYVRVRLMDPDSGTVYGEGVTSNLGSGRSTAVIGGVVTPTLTGVKRVRLEAYPAELAGATNVPVLDYPGNHFTVLPMPA